LLKPDSYDQSTKISIDSLYLVLRIVIFCQLYIIENRNAKLQHLSLYVKERKRYNILSIKAYNTA